MEMGSRDRQKRQGPFPQARYWCDSSKEDRHLREF